MIVNELLENKIEIQYDKELNRYYVFTHGIEEALELEMKDITLNTLLTIVLHQLEYKKKNGTSIAEINLASLKIEEAMVAIKNIKESNICQMM